MDKDARRLAAGYAQQKLSNLLGMNAPISSLAAKHAEICQRGQPLEQRFDGTILLPVTHE